MNETTLLFLKKWFHTYVHSFYSADEQLQFHVRLKEEHTLRVLQHASAISTWLGCSKAQIQLAEIAALLHDIGRFKQYQTYRTFNDGLSVNHAELGLAVLAETNILTAAGLSEQQQSNIKMAILYHNRRTIPSELQDECSLIAKITRDADKLDIFSMLVTDDAKSKIPQPPELKQAANYSLQIIEVLLQGRLVKPKDIQTSADLMLFRLSWIYDIYFGYSFSYILQNQYIERMIKTLPETEDVQRVYQYIMRYVECR